MKLKYLLLTLLMACIIQVWAQPPVFKPGYLVKSDGDTLRGYIKNTAARKLTHEIHFKSRTKDKNVRTFTPDQVIAAFVQAEENKKWQQHALNRYQAKLLKNKWFREAAISNPKINNNKYLVATKIQNDSIQNRLFLRKIISGPVTLYSGSAKGSTPHYYLQAADSAVYPVRPGSYLGLLKVLLPDCAHIDAGNAGGIKIGLEPLTALIAAYNACLVPAAEIQISQAPEPLRFVFGVKGGIITSKVHYTDDIAQQIDRTNRYPEQYTAKQGFTGGIFVNIGQDGAFSLQPELLYTIKGGRVTKEVFDGVYYMDFYRDYDYSDFTLHYLQLPVMAQLAGRLGPVQPYLGAGFIVGKAIYQQHTRTSARHYIAEPNRNTAQDKAKLLFDGLEYGGAIAAGLKYAFLEKEAFIEVRSEKTRIPRNFVNSNLINTSFQITAGIALF